MNNTLSLTLPAEFLELCTKDGTTPETVLKGFIADLCDITSLATNPRQDGYSTNGSDERMYARIYYERVGYPWLKTEPR